MRLTDFKALTFDCYGTLIDWETGMIEALQAADRQGWPSRCRATRCWKRMPGTSRRSRPQTPGKLYRDLLAVVYRRLAEEWGVAAILGRVRRLRPQSFATGRPFPIPPLRCSTSSSTTSSSSCRTSTTKASASATRSSASSSTPSTRPRTSAPTSPASRNFEYMLTQLQTLGVEKRRDPAHRREPVPRSQAGESGRAGVVLDLSSAQ